MEWSGVEGRVGGKKTRLVSMGLPVPVPWCRAHPSCRSSTWAVSQRASQSVSHQLPPPSRGDGGKLAPLGETR